LSRSLKNSGFRFPCDYRSTACCDAYRRYRRLQHEIRLNDAERARVPPATVAVEAGAVKALWQHLFD